MSTTVSRNPYRGALAVAAIVLGTGIAAAASTPGITDTEIKIGGICPSSGPIASFVTICAMQDAYFKMINDRDGGVLMKDGKRRKINYIYYNDEYSPPRTVEQARRLVERDQVALIIGPLGSATGLAIRDYLNKKGVPQLSVGSGLSTFSAAIDTYPWTIGWQVAYTTEASIFGEFVKSEKPNAKVAALYQNDDFGKELLGAFTKAVAGSGVEVVASQSYEVTSPSVDSQITNLAASGADVFLSFGVPKFTAQALRKIRETSWRPMIIVANISASAKATMEPAGKEASDGVYSAISMMDPTSPDFASTPDIKAYREIGGKYGGTGLNLDDPITMYGFGQAQTMVEVLKAAKEPTRESINESAHHICNIPVMGLIPGAKVCMDGKADPFPVETMQIVKFNNGGWQLIGKPVTAYEGKTPSRDAK